MELFDKDIPILSEDSKQEDYDNVAESFPQYGKSYVFNASYKERRDSIQKAYNCCKEYLDDDFTETIRVENNFVNRLWELQICLSFLYNGYTLVKPPKGKNKVSRPDFCVLDSNGNKIWVEAVSSNLGNVNPVPDKPVMVSGQIYSRQSNIRDEIELTAPRIINSVISKYKKRTSYLSSIDFSADDKFIIAVNTYNINHREPGDMSKELALYGMGLTHIKQNGESFKDFNWSIPKKTSSGDSVDIQSALFFYDDYDKLSAVITGSHWFYFGEDFEKQISNNIHTYFNHTATNPIFLEDICFGKKSYMICDDEKCELKNI